MVEPQRMHIVHTASELQACIRFSCCSPLASASAAALDCVRSNCFPDCVRFAAAPQLRPLQFCSPIASASTLLPNGILFVCYSRLVRFNCCSPIASASHRIDYQLPKYTHKQRDRAIGSGSVWLTDMYKGGPHNIHSPEWSHTRTHTHTHTHHTHTHTHTQFGCSTPAVLEDSGHVHYSRTFFVEFEVQSTKVARHYSLVPPHEHPTSIAHTQTDTWLKS